MRLLSANFCGIIQPQPIPRKASSSDPAASTSPITARLVSRDFPRHTVRPRNFFHKLSRITFSSVDFPHPCARIRPSRNSRTIDPVASPQTEVVSQTDFYGLKLRGRGKVRDIYELDDRLLIVATDRLSAFDVVLPTPIPDKGRV